MDFRDLAESLLRRAQAAGAEAADILIVESDDFSTTVRMGEVETLTDAGSKALGLRVFIGRRTANVHTSDFSKAALDRLVLDAVEMARAAGEDPAAGLPDEAPASETPDLGLFDPAVLQLPADERIAMARRAEQAAFAVDPEIRNSHGASLSCSVGSIVLANTLGFRGSYRSSSISLSVVPVAVRDGRMERDYWYTSGRALADLDAPEEVGRIAASRALRRLGALKIATCEVPVVFDPETAAEILAHVFQALSGYAVFRNATFFKDRLGEIVAARCVTVVDEGRRPRGLGSRPFDGEGLSTRTNVPIENGVLRHYMCDTYAARKIGARSTGSARRGVAGGPTAGASNLYLRPGEIDPERILGEVDRGFYVTDLIGFGVNLVTGDYSQGATGHWIEAGRLAHPVNEVTIAGNLNAILRDVDAVGNDLVFRGSIASPTVRVSRMTVAGR
jgi:PmbA protein